MYKSYNDTGVISHVSEIIILFFYQVKLSVQKEIQEGAVLQQDFIVEFLVTGQMCDDCHRVEAKDYWQAVVQVSNSNRTIVTAIKITMTVTAAAIRRWREQ